MNLQENEELKKQEGISIDKVNKIIRKGYTCAIDGNTLWVNTETDEIVKFVVKDRALLWKFYCKEVQITIEILESKNEEINKIKL